MAAEMVLIGGNKLRNLLKKLTLVDASVKVLSQLSTVRQLYRWQGNRADQRADDSGKEIFFWSKTSAVPATYRPLLLE
jgi:hypothetical protein